MTSAVRLQGITVAIATAGRRTQMRATVERLAHLQPQPGVVLVVPATPDDFDEDHARHTLTATRLVVVRPHGKGLTVQRNAALTWLQAQPGEIVVFLDDDFYPAADYLRRIDDLFTRYPDTVAFTGRPALDGATGPGIDQAAAQAMLARLDAQAPASVEQTTYGAYGCNMSLRLAPIHRHALRFDEELPLYSWLEDIDFSRRIAHHGTVRESTLLRGVHLGVKGGRVSGVRFGYSQVANPLHCVRKRSMTVRYAVRHMARNVAMNVARSLWPEPWVDRRGRLLGNLLAIGDLVRRRMHPMRVLDL